MELLRTPRYTQEPVFTGVEGESRYARAQRPPIGDPSCKLMSADMPDWRPRSSPRTPLMVSPRVTAMGWQRYAVMTRSSFSMGCLRPTDTAYWEKDPSQRASLGGYLTHSKMAETMDKLSLVKSACNRSIVCISLYMVNSSSFVTSSPVFHKCGRGMKSECNKL